MIAGPSIQDVKLAAAHHFGVKPSEIDGPRRDRQLLHVRHIAMAAAKRITSASLPQIGRRFGNRDHSTVIHAVRRIEALAAHDLGVASALSAIEARVASQEEERAPEPAAPEPAARVVVVHVPQTRPEVAALLEAVARLEQDRFSVVEARAITNVIEAGRLARQAIAGGVR